MPRKPAHRVHRTRQVIDKNFVGLAEKTFAVLEALSRSRGSCLGRDEILQAVAISAPSLDRLLYSIEKLRYIEETGEGKYQLAPNFYQLSEEAAKYQYIPALAKPMFTQLLSEFGESVHIGILENGLCTVVAAVESQFPFSFSAEAGEWNYAHATAMGKCLLAFASSEDRAMVLQQRGLPRLTDSTITDPEKFLAELDEVKGRGYAINISESMEGAVCVAAPIFNSENVVIASLSISGPSHRMVKNLGRITQGIVPAATRLSLLLGCGNSNLGDLLPAA